MPPPPDPETTPAPASAERPSHELPYRSDLLANLSALVLLWGSPAFQERLRIRSHEPLDLSSSLVLWGLGSRGPVRPSALARGLSTGRSNVSKIVGRLESAGLVRRTPDPADRRASLVALTPAGEVRAGTMLDVGDALVTDLLDDWSSEDVERFTTYARRFVAAAIAQADLLPGAGGE